MPPSPPAQEKNEISLIGETSGAAVKSLMRFTASSRTRRSDGELGGEHVHVVRPAVVPEVPDDLLPAVARRLEHAAAQLKS